MPRRVRKGETCFGRGWLGQAMLGSDKFFCSMSS